MAHATDTTPIAQNQAVVNQRANRPKMGRPSDYRPEYCQQIVEYFESRPLMMRTLPSQDGTPAENVRAICSEMPTFAGFAVSIGSSAMALQRWEIAHEDFRMARARCKSIMEHWLTQGLISGAANPTGAIFVAKNILGWTDKQQIETTTVQADSPDTSALKLAIASATPDQLQQMQTLVAAMLANAPAIEASTVVG